MLRIPVLRSGLYTKIFLSLGARSVVPRHIHKLTGFFIGPAIVEKQQQGESFNFVNVDVIVKKMPFYFVFFHIKLTILAVTSDQPR